METEFKVLLVEDNPGDAFLVKFYLDESVVSTYDLTHVEFLNDAVKILQKTHFDVILLDLNLPDSDGVETVEKILTKAPDSMVIVLTGLTDEELGLQTVKMGAQDFLVKGQFDGKVLNSAIRYSFERFKLNKQLKDYALQLDNVRQQFQETQKIGYIGFWELMPSDKSMSFTPELYELLNVSQEKFDPVLDNFISLAEKEDKAKLAERFSAILSSGEPFEDEFTLNSGSGKKFKIRAKALQKGNDRISRVVGVIQAL